MLFRLILLLTLCGCQEAGTVQVLMNFDRSSGFYAAPFPSDDLLAVDGTISLAGFPNPGKVGLIEQGLALLKSSHGFALSAAIFFQLSAAIDPMRLPTLARSIAADSPVFLLGVDATAPDFLRRYPLKVAFLPDGGPFGALNLLSLLPLQGTPLLPRTHYAAVVLRRLGDAQGRDLAKSPVLQALANGSAPSGLSTMAFGRYREALQTLAKGGIPSDEIAGLTVFTTGAPTEEMAEFRADALARPLPKFLTAPVRGELFPDYCVYSTTLAMPVYQQGVPPYAAQGGGWSVDAQGKPQLQRMEEANVVITLPRTAMAASGFPLVVFVRTGGGGERPLVDRGTRAVAGGAAVTPGTGPALFFARAGYAGISLDGPLGGLRNTTHGD